MIDMCGEREAAEEAIDERWRSPDAVTCLARLPPTGLLPRSLFLLLLLLFCV
jgi:hypothetical protein